MSAKEVPYTRLSSLAQQDFASTVAKPTLLQRDLKTAAQARPDVAEFEELSSECYVETIECPRDHSRTALAVYEKGQVRITDRYEHNGRTYIPRDRNDGMFRITRLPNGAESYESVELLLGDTVKLLCDCVDLEASAAQLISSFILSSWFPEKVPVAPYLALAGMPRSGKTTLLRLLEMLCRHSILVTDVSPAALYGAYEQSIPTLLIDETSTAADQRKFYHLLRTGSTPGGVGLRRDMVLNCYGPKVCVWTDLPTDMAVRSRCVIIPMQESDRNLTRVSDPQIKLRAEKLQQQYLQLRFERFNQKPDYSANTGLSSRARDLYEALAYPFFDQLEHCKNLAALIEDQEQFNRDEFSLIEAAVLNTVFNLIHLAPLDQVIPVLVGHIGECTETTLKTVGEPMEVTPHSVGKILTRFGIKRERRRNRGYFVIFDQRRKRSIHLLLKRYGSYPSLAKLGMQPAYKCTLCEELQIPILAPEAAIHSQTQGPDASGVLSFAKKLKKYKPKRKMSRVRSRVSRK